MKHTAVVVIPVYQENPTDDEKKSLQQCVKIFEKRHICFVTYEELNISQYLQITAQHSSVGTIFFERKYFEGIQGYNRLCLHKQFYSAFSQFKYMLIYQLDAWCFRDELDYWCSLGFDYIGAPWFEEYGSYEEGKKLWAVGNGGLSLRKMQYFLKVLSWKFPLMKPQWNKLYIPHFLLYYLGRHNTVSFFQNSISTHEDYFFSQMLQDSWLPPNVPKCEEAMAFAFERSPSYLFRLTKGKLPFGCHAYLKNEYCSFWYHYIQ